jgi:hypothetical protein
MNRKRMLSRFCWNPTRSDSDKTFHFLKSTIPKLQKLSIRQNKKKQKRVTTSITNIGHPSLDEDWKWTSTGCDKTAFPEEVSETNVCDSP